MDDMNINSGTGSEEMPQRAVSIYGQNEGMDDFPVLKAFQQYIDAEQEKARKRILWLGMFFGAVLIVVVVVFMILIHGINMRNQTLSDRLVEYAMKEADRRQTVQPNTPAVVPAQQNDAALKAMTETLVAIQKKMESSSKDAEKKKSEKALADLSAQQESLKLQRMQNQLEVEKKLLAQERERLHQIEVERQRRKLYPELYEESGRKNTPSRSRMLTDDDIREIIREAYPESEREESKLAPAAKKTNQKKTVEAEPEEEAEAEDDAIEYFKDDDYTIPVDVKGAGSKVRFTVPVD